MTGAFRAVSAGEVCPEHQLPKRQSRIPRLFHSWRRFSLRQGCSSPHPPVPTRRPSTSSPTTGCRSGAWPVKYQQPCPRCANRGQCWPQRRPSSGFTPAPLAHAQAAHHANSSRRLLPSSPGARCEANPQWTASWLEIALWTGESTTATWRCAFRCKPTPPAEPTTERGDTPADTASSACAPRIAGTSR
jgi:hypothetical protein